MDKQSKKQRKAGRVNMSKHFINPKQVFKPERGAPMEEDSDDDVFDEDELNQEEGDLQEEEEIVEENKDMEEDDGETGRVTGTKDVIEDPEEKVKVVTEAFIPGQSMAEPNEELEVSGGAYKMLHTLSLEWSCMSFDFVPDTLGALREQPPHTLYFITGSQVETGISNKVSLVKVSSMCYTNEDEESEDEDSENNELKPKIEQSCPYSDPVLVSSEAKFPANVNRVRTLKQKPGYAALWGDNGNIYVYDMTAHFEGVEGGISVKGKEVKSVLHQQCEGFALDWSSVVEGRLISGCLNGRLSLWEYDGSEWRGSPESYLGHKKSVEDLQWSPNEADVFLSCSCDQTIRLWDARSKERCVKSIKAHGSDVNVINWNKLNTFQVVSGADNGELKVWDFRTFDFPIATFDWHKKAITSVEWCPHDETSFMASSEDDTVSFWDISMEADKEAAEKYHVQEEKIPAQLMFLHQGQKNIKEAHWHQQIKGVVATTAWDGMNVFQPCNF
ncbi:glutamate-rich WD repeat-containing protein, putative [Entamoeba invadens IP1]|uniref:Glutamate-rich WD repeat-containing protein, putative n=1 Tax=Entamoeba invadens IP1 TaxID=370355 RepID=A0A0A1U138_ENTIV|nr:glutamate-rich WD repeat-containing protein, putative [Entamoeba invadens IP1]ELP84623.1 glutamate-rich WD repeat-containing protein, putative [Entamoeba invadens IP1]|eukprot:XP_004183969.1 glutamate-rich WD repeat-containing protein, putative [Entamoeba invadens IP1]